MTDKVFLCVPSKNAILSFEPGTGDNLTQEDIDMGFNDYLNWYTKEMNPIDLSEEADGGMVLFNNEVDPYREDLRFAIPAVLHEAFGDGTLPYIILNGSDEDRYKEVKVSTPAGEIVIKIGTDSTYPGVYIDLRRGKCDCDAPLAMVEYTPDETETREPAVVTRVWNDVRKEDHQTRVVHQGIEEYFKELQD